MATLRVPRDQVEQVLAERIRLGEELAAQEKVAERSAGWRDWNLLFERWRDHSLRELAALYEGDEESSHFAFAADAGSHSTPSATFPYTKRALDDCLLTLRSYVIRLELAIEPVKRKATPKSVAKPRRKPRVEMDAPRTGVLVVHGGAARGYRESVAGYIGELGLHA